MRERGLKIGVLTDVPYGMGRDFVERDLAPIITQIDVALTSVEVGHRKPAPHGFLTLAATLGVPSDRILFVGNEAKDIQGANGAGMVSALLVRSPDGDGNRGIVPNYGQDATIFSLRELESLVREITQSSWVNRRQ